MDIQSQVLVDFMRRFPPLSSEEPEDILLFVGLEKIQNKGTVDDRNFVTRVLP